MYLLDNLNNNMRKIKNKKITKINANITKRTEKNNNLNCT